MTVGDGVDGDRVVVGTVDGDNMVDRLGYSFS